MNSGTAFDGNLKDSVVCITQDPAPQPDLVVLGHITLGVVNDVKICVDETDRNL